MPFFSSNKFTPKKPLQRKPNSFPKNKFNEKDHLNLDIGDIKLNLGDQQVLFEDGEWVPESGVVGNKHKENQQLRQQVQQLETERNFLKLKVEVLLDMLTETTAEAHIQDKEITRLRQELSRVTIQ